MNLAFGVVDDDESRAATPQPYGASVSMPASSATMSNPYGALIRAARDPFVDPIRGLAVAGEPRLQAGNNASGKGGKVPSYPAAHVSSNQSSTSTPQRPPPAKQASLSPVRMEKGTYRSDTSRPKQPYGKAG